MVFAAPDAYNNNLENARIAAWFITGLRHEAIRLGNKNRRLKKHELLILNGSINQGSDYEVTEMLGKRKIIPTLKPKWVIKYCYLYIRQAMGKEFDQGSNLSNKS